VKRLIACTLAVTLGAVVVRSQTAVNVQIDVAANRHPIDPHIYGVAYADAPSLADLHVAVNRWGGNATTRYNWQTNASNRASDWYFESIASSSATPGADADTFVSLAKANGAEPLLTIPMIGWVAKVGANRGNLASFSIAKYGHRRARILSISPMPATACPPRRASHSSRATTPMTRTFPRPRPRPFSRVGCSIS
jgi:Glycoside hydrolase family 44